MRDRALERASARPCVWGNVLPVQRAHALASLAAAEAAPVVVTPSICSCHPWSKACEASAEAWVTAAPIRLCRLGRALEAAVPSARSASCELLEAAWRKPCAPCATRRRAKRFAPRQIPGGTVAHDALADAAHVPTCSGRQSTHCYSQGRCAGPRIARRAAARDGL